MEGRQSIDFGQLGDVIKTAYQTGIHNAGKKSFNDKPWFDEECKRARKYSFAWLKMFRSTSEDFFRRLYIEANSKYKDLCKTKKKLHYEAEAKKLSEYKNSADFWRCVAKLNGKKFIISETLGPDTLCQHFSQLLNPITDPCTFHFAQTSFESEELDAPITVAEINAAYKSLKDGKAPGSDGIPTEFYKYGTPELTKMLEALFNNVLEHGVVPQQFKEALIFPVFKKGCRSQPSNYRGISFLNGSYKVFTTVLQKRLTSWININSLLKEFQAGFRSGYSTVDQIFVLKSIAEAYAAQRKKLYVFFVDFRAAFDSINRGSLMYKLFAKGMSKKFGRVIQNIYEETLVAVWNGENASNWFKTNAGVRQGCTLSPLLFALFIDDIVDSLPGGIEFAGIVIKALLFADDIVLMANSPETLQRMINRLYEFCKMWSLIINLEKSKVMIFKKGGGRRCCNEKWFLSGEQIEVVKKYNYLGMIFTQNLSMEDHLKCKLQKAKIAINTTWRKCFANKYIAHSSKFRVFEAVSESTMLYAAQVWGGSRFEEVEKLLRFYIKRIFRLPPNTPNYAIMLETGLSPLATKTLKLQVDYILKVFNMSSERLPRKVALEALRCNTGWYTKWNDLAHACGISLDLDEANMESWKPKLYQLIAAVDLNFRQQWEREASESLHRSIYSQLNYNLGDRNYFHDDNSCEEISLMIKLRAELLPLNYQPHREDLPVLCNICNMAEREDIFHFVGRCPTLRETRRHFFGVDRISDEQILNMLNELNVTLLFAYCKTALAYRQRIITESF